MRPARRRRAKSALMPALLAAAGALLLVANLGIIPPSRFALPALGTLVGVFLVATAQGRPARFAIGLSLMGCFAVLLLSRLGYLPAPGTIWPAFLVVMAAAMVLARLRGRE